MTSTAEAVRALELIGLHAELKETGSSDYERLFALDSEGVTLARITIFKGEYQQSKWYVSGAHFDTRRMHSHEWHPIQFARVLRGLKPFTAEQRSEIEDAALVIADQRREEILKQRAQANALREQPKRYRAIRKAASRQYVCRVIHEIPDGAP
jgi:hypothetical protein